MIVSLIAPCCNERKYIGAFLESLSRQELPAEIQVDLLVVDGMSDDGTREVLNRFRPQQGTFRIIDNPERFVSTALNRGIRASRGEVILRIDVHTEYHPTYVRECLRVLETTGADNVGGPARTRSQSWLGRSIAAAYHSSFSNGGSRFHLESYEGYTDTVPYGCWRRDVFDRVGMFDEWLVRNQDDEFNLRLIRAGGTVWQSPAIISWYHPRSSLRALFQQYFQYGFWKIPVIKKHRLPASWRHLVPGAFVLAVLLLLFVCLLSVAAGPTHVLALSAIALGTLLGVHGLACVAASLLAARRHGWSLLPVLPVVFATYHVSYGLGFLLGIWHWHCGNIRSAHATEIYSQISR